MTIKGANRSRIAAASLVRAKGDLNAQVGITLITQADLPPPQN